MKFEGMQRYTQYLNWYVEESYKPRSIKFMTTITLILCLASFIVVPTLLSKCDVNVAPKPVSQAQIKYETPKAFRMKSPTEEQMAKYHDLLIVMQVAR